MKEAASELNEEAKTLLPETMDYLCALPWPGNVRQLENFCRWITVMATGREIHMEDLPPELLGQEKEESVGDDWERVLRRWATKALSDMSEGDKGLLDDAIPRFERIMIESALKQTAGRKRDASILLGWGRNTLTRKIQELGMASDGLAE